MVKSPIQDHRLRTNGVFTKEFRGNFLLHLALVQNRPGRLHRLMNTAFHSRFHSLVRAMPNNKEAFTDLLPRTNHPPTREGTGPSLEIHPASDARRK